MEAIKKIQRRIDNEVAPDHIGLYPTADGEAVVRVEFGRKTISLPLSEGEEVTGDRDALERPGQLLVEVREDDGGITDPAVLSHVGTIRLIRGFNPATEPTSAEYAAITEGYVNETQHNAQHLPVDPDGLCRYWLFE